MSTGRIQWLDPGPVIRFLGGDPVEALIIGTSRFQNDLTLYIQIPVAHAQGVGHVVYLCKVYSAYRHVAWQRT